MIRYISNKGGGPAVDFETAILNGFATDGGLYVPDKVPKISLAQLTEWRNLSYLDLAFEILSLFIDRSVISAAELRQLLETAYAPFENKEIIRLHQLKSRKETYVVELFHGPTLSFKDIGMAFLVNLFHFFLARKKDYRTLLVATTGDTGPAAAYFSAGKSTLDTWVLYPKGKITEMQERQMTTLPHANIHPLGVADCPEGGDDLDVVIAQLFADQAFRNKLKISSVNSINWGRIMMQTVHYFYSYFQVVPQVGETIDIAVPSGAFGNLCAGGLARKMGLPVAQFIVANNSNACLHRIFSEGRFSKQKLHETVSSAIDILIPANFWRYLHFATNGAKASLIASLMDEFAEKGEVVFDTEIYQEFAAGFLSCSTSDMETLELIKATFEKEGYLLDPHGAVALAAIDTLQSQLENRRLLCFATAHPAKFPAAMKKALSCEKLPSQALHDSVEVARKSCEKVYLCDHSYLKEALKKMMEQSWELKEKPNKREPSFLNM